MTPIHLVIPDAALREAVAEQLNLANLGGVQEVSSLPEASSKLVIVILDEAAMDAKLVKKGRSLENGQTTILLLGNLPAGADEDSVTEQFSKPVRLGHLLARLRFYIEVAPRLRSAPLAIGSYKLEAQQRNLTRGDEVVRLTEKETALLEYLAQSVEAVGREELLAGVWGYDARMDTHTLETHIYQLRRKIGAELIVNEGGHYRLVK